MKVKQQSDGTYSVLGEGGNVLSAGLTSLAAANYWMKHNQDAASAVVREAFEDKSFVGQSTKTSDTPDSLKQIMRDNSLALDTTLNRQTKG